MITALMTTPKFTEENRDVNAIYRIIVNSFQGIDHNWYKNISPNIKNIIELDVKSTLRNDIEERIWTLEKYLIRQFEKYELYKTLIKPNKKKEKKYCIS